MPPGQTNIGQLSLSRATGPVPLRAWPHLAIKHHFAAGCSSPLPSHVLASLCLAAFLLLPVTSINAQSLSVDGRLVFEQVIRDGTGGPDGLDRVRSVAVSPDGAHVYAAGLNDDGVAVFARDAASGNLTFVEVHKDGVDGVDGLDGAQSISVSPNGNHIYVGSFFDDALAVFARDPVTGSLSFIEALFDGVDGVEGLRGVWSVTVSPDGAHVYTVGIDDALTVFARHAKTGTLTFVEVHKDGISGVDGLDGAISVTVSPDGAQVYVAGLSDHALAVFERDVGSGSLTWVQVLKDGVGGIEGLAGAQSVSVSPDGVHIYAAGGIDGALAVFTRDSATDLLTFVQAQADGAIGVGSVTVSPDGANVYAAARNSGAVTVFHRNRRTGLLTFVETHIDGDAGIDGLDGAHSLAVSPDGAHVYAAAEFDDAVALFTRNVVSGALTFIEVIKDDIDGLRGARSVIVSPDGAHVYVASWHDDAVAVFARNTNANGELVFVELQRDDTDGVDGLDRATDVTVSPDGAHVYVASGSEGIAAFGRDAPSGKLAFIETHKSVIEGGNDVLRFADSVTVGPDGAHVYVASSFANSVVVFARNAASGALTFIETQVNGRASTDGLGGASSVTVSPDGTHVYVASRVDHAVAVFERDGASGALAFVEARKDGDGVVDGLVGARSVRVSPDGLHIYVASETSNAVAVFGRNVANGTLTFVEALKDGDGSIDGLVGARSVNISSDGAHVYVASDVSNAVAAFERSSASGALTFVGAERDDIGDVDGLAGATSVVVTPDGLHVYVAGTVDDAVVLLDRHSSSGALSFREAKKDGAGKIFGLLSVKSLTVSPDGTHVYVGGLNDRGAVAIFSRHATSGELTFAGSHKDTFGSFPGLTGPNAVAISPDGAHVYVASSGAVAVFNRDATSGALAFFQIQDPPTGLSAASAAIVSPDGAHVYVTSQTGNDIVVFERNTTSGALTFVEAIEDGNGNVDGLAGAQSVVVSPDGGHVYVASLFDVAVAVFARDTASGALTFVEAQKDGDGIVHGLIGARSVTVSPDGLHVYVAAAGDNAVAVFERNTASGALTFVEAQIDGGGIVDGLVGAHSVVVSPDGEHVYAAANRDNAVAVFKRETPTGQLTFVEAKKDGIGGVDGLGGANLVALSSDGHHLYATGRDENAVVVFTRLSDFDHDGLADDADLDDDNDGMPDAFETANGLDPFDASDALDDEDLDGLNNVGEFKFGSDLFNPDSDGDGILDGDEVAAGRNPAVNEPAVITIINTILLDEK